MQRIYVHPLPVRIWHWLNAVGFVALVLTGLQIRYVGAFAVVSLQTAVRVHDFVGFAVIADYALWLGYYLCSRRIRCYLPRLTPRRYVEASMRQMKYYCSGMFRGEPNPHRIGIYDKFNPMQATLYQVVMVVLLPIQFLTGVLLWDLRRFSDQVAFFGGLRVVDTVHVVIFVVFVAYLFVHPYFGTLGASRTAQYRAMITGYEDVEDVEMVASAEREPT